MHPIGESKTNCKTTPKKLYDSAIFQNLGTYEDYLNKTPSFTAREWHTENKFSKYFVANKNKSGFITSIDYLINPAENKNERLSDYCKAERYNNLTIDSPYPSNLLLEVMDGICPNGFYEVNSRFITLELSHPCNSILSSFSGLVSASGLVISMAWEVATDDWSYNTVIPAMIGGAKIGLDLFQCINQFPEFEKTKNFAEVKSCVADNSEFIKEDNCKADPILPYYFYFGRYHLFQEPSHVEVIGNTTNQYFSNDKDLGIFLGIKNGYLDVFNGKCPDGYKKDSNEFHLFQETTVHPTNCQIFDWAQLGALVGFAIPYLMKQNLLTTLTEIVFITNLYLLFKKEEECNRLSKENDPYPIQNKYYGEVKHCVPNQNEFEPNQDSSVLVQALDNPEL